MAAAGFEEIHDFTGLIPGGTGGTKRVCPFMSNPATNNYVYCLGTSCQLWDPDAPGLLNDGNCGANSYDRHKLERHIHQSHEHTRMHSCSEIPDVNNCGNVPFLSQMNATKIPYASILLNEWMNKEDLDFDTFRYGKDFYIQDTVINMPETLYQFQTATNFVPDGNASKINWDEYIYWKDEAAGNYIPWAVITLTGSNPLNLNVGDTFVDPGATATDSVDGNVTADIEVITNNVNTSIAGNYKVIYKVVNSKNIISKKTRTVVVSAV